jgi:hypothetical protein
VAAPVFLVREVMIAKVGLLTKEAATAGAGWLRLGGSQSSENGGYTSVSSMV